RARASTRGRPPRGAGRSRSSRGSGSCGYSSMARRTTGELIRVADLVTAVKFAEEVGLIAGRLPGHVEDLVARPEVRRRVAVAVEAAAHEERLVLIGEGHLIDAAVTLDASDPLADVDAVVEVDETRQVVDALPGDRVAVLEARPHRLQGRAAEPDF